MEGKEHDWKSRGAQASSGGLPHFHFWYVHITNCENFPCPEELLQACSSFQCQMSFLFFFFFLPFSLLPLHIMAFTAMGRALAAPINKGEVGSGLFHPSLSWSCVCGAGGSERAGFIHVPSSHPPVGTSHSH